MKYLKVNLSGNLGSYSPEALAILIKNSNAIEVSSVEICEQPEPVTVPVVKRGILRSPAEICGCDRALSIDYDKGGMFYNLHKDNTNIGLTMPIDEYDFPVEFYKDVTETIDWSAIKNGDLIEVEYKTHKVAGYYWALNNVITVRVTNEETDTNQRYITNDIVKSVVILKRAKS